jgi:hypothetical protein
MIGNSIVIEFEPNARFQRYFFARATSSRAICDQSAFHLQFANHISPDVASGFQMIAP